VLLDGKIAHGARIDVRRALHKPSQRRADLQIEASPIGDAFCPVFEHTGHANVSTTLDIYSHLFAAREDKSAAAINTAANSVVFGVSRVDM
jgi:hypothetical protein